MMRTFKVKNYKGKLVESLSRFQKKYPELKICKVCEDKEELRIKTEAYLHGFTNMKDHKKLLWEFIEEYGKEIDEIVERLFKEKIDWGTLKYNVFSRKSRVEIMRGDFILKQHVDGLTTHNSSPNLLTNKFLDQDDRREIVNDAHRFLFEYSDKIKELRTKLYELMTNLPEKYKNICLIAFANLLLGNKDKGTVTKWRFELNFADWRYCFLSKIDSVNLSPEYLTNYGPDVSYKDKDYYILGYKFGEVYPKKEDF